MTRKNRFLEMFCKCITIKKNVYHISIQTLYFVEAHLAAITASSLLGCDATSLANLCLESFSHSSLQILSSCLTLNPGHREAFYSLFWLGQGVTRVGILCPFFYVLYFYALAWYGSESGCLLNGVQL